MTWLRLGTMPIIPLLALAGVAGCGGDEEWAFAAGLDGLLLSGEFCRTTLAEAVRPPYSTGSRFLEIEEGRVFHSDMGVSSFRIYVYPNRRECDAALEAWKRAVAAREGN